MVGAKEVPRKARHTVGMRYQTVPIKGQGCGSRISLRTSPGRGWEVDMSVGSERSDQPVVW